MVRPPRAGVVRGDPVTGGEGVTDVTGVVITVSKGDVAAGDTGSDPPF